jgi:hypothetical protein
MEDFCPHGLGCCPMEDFCPHGLDCCPMEKSFFFFFVTIDLIVVLWICISFAIDLIVVLWLFSFPWAWLLPYGEFMLPWTWLLSYGRVSAPMDLVVAL